MPADQEVTLYGGGMLIFDEFGRVKFHVYNLFRRAFQTSRLRYLWEYGFFTRGGAPAPLLLPAPHARPRRETEYREEW